MNYQGRDLNARALWESLGVSIPEHDSGTFSSLLYCPNPAHDNSRSPAFQVNLVKPLVHCFSRCGVEGTYDHAVSVVLGCKEREARRYIMQFTRVGLGVVEPLRREGKKTLGHLAPIARDVERFNRGEYTWLSKEARAYLDRRGVDAPTRGRWQVGWDEEAERIVIPAFDERGVLRFLIRRAIDGRSPKYLYSEGAEKTSILFGLLRVPRSQRILALVEGSLDVVALTKLGIDFAVGTLGSGLSTRQVRLVYERDCERVYCFFDRDQAGVQNTLDAIEKLPRSSLYVVRYPHERSDPAEFLPAEARRAFERAVPAHEFLRHAGRLSSRSRRKERVM